MLLDAVRRYVENAVIIFVALFRWFELHSYVATKLVLPVQQVLFFGLLAVSAGDPERVSFIVIGNSIVIAGLGGLWAAATVGEERAQGTLPLLLASPAIRLLNFSQRGLLHILDGLLTVAVAMAFGALVFHLDLARVDYGLFTAAVLVGVMSSITLGLLLGALSLAFAETYFVANSFYFALLVLAGVNVSIGLLPGWLQVPSQVLPFTRSIAAARAAAAGTPLGEQLSSLLVEVGIAAGYLLIGFALLRLMEVVAVRRGSLEEM